MENNIIRVGVDIGNKNLKICAEEGQAHEIPASYRIVDEYDYKNGISRPDMEKVKYNGEFYFVGLQCQNGLPHNKGDKGSRELASMIKLVGLARELRRQGLNKGRFYVASGTPVNDYDEYRQDYMDLLITQGDQYEIIELNGELFEIRVEDAILTKQSACVAPTIPNWKKSDFVLADFGGGTLDVAHFQRGVRGRYITIDFPLNQILEELGNRLNVYRLGISPRPNMMDSGFIHTMEEIILKGRYRNLTSISVDGSQVSLKEFCSKWLQDRVDATIEDIKIKLRLSDTDSQHIPVYYVGGGAKLLATELANNNTFTNKNIVENPHFANVSIYQIMASKNNWSGINDKQINQS